MELVCKKERANEVDPKGCPRRWRPVVISARVESSFPPMMEVDTEKVPRANLMESATTLPVRTMVGMEEVPLVEDMMRVLSKLK